MPTPNSKTVRLARGRHASPLEGVCVMELASMVAGEPFSDQPASVSPVIGAFLRAYNDAATEDQRQRLYRYALEVIGTRAGGAIERARAGVCLRELQARGRTRTRLGRAAQRVVALLRPRLVSAALGRAASHSDAAAGVSDSLRLVDELIELWRPRANLERVGGHCNGPDLREVVGIG